MSEAIAVLINDVHYNINTLELADNSMRQAIYKANQLQIPLIVAGDLHDTKANMRAECVNAMLRTFGKVQTRCFIIVGNHDLINEKALQNSLEFLEGQNEKVSLVRKHLQPKVSGMPFHMLAYHSDKEELRNVLNTIPEGSTLIMHQGLQGSSSGEYVQDKSAINHEDVSDFRVISGHYHTRQDIKTGRPRKGAVGLFSYIGNPYTLNFAEANDPEKGFQILMSDGMLEFVSTNLRKHVVYEIVLHETPRDTMPFVSVGDLLWIKIKGPKHELLTVDKENTKAEIEFHTGLSLPESFRLDLIPTDTVSSKIDTTNKTQREVLDEIITSKVDLRDETISKLKTLWKNL